MTSSASGSTPRREHLEADSTERASSRRVRRAPRLTPFLILGLLAGLIVAAALNWSGPDSASYSAARSFGFLGVLFGGLGLLGGGIAFIIADSRRH